MKQLQKILPTAKSRFVFLIGDEGAILVYLENGAVVRRLFAASSTPENVLSFTELLKAHPGTPIYVMVDMMDQSYVRHALPPVTQMGLGKLVQRRLDRDFSKDDIKGALNLGREAEGRKDWNFLLIALSHSEVLKGWLNLVYELPNRFSGIYLVPVECELFIRSLDAALGSQNKRISEQDAPPQSLAEIKEQIKTAEDAPPPAQKKKFGKIGALKLPSIKVSASKKTSKKKKASAETEEGQRSQWQILVCHNKVGGFRQVVLKNGKLIFTRLTQAVNESQPEVLAGNVEQEILNTIEYLKRLSYNPKTGLDIYIIVAQEIKSSISTLRFGATNAHVLTPFEAAELLKLKQAVLSGDRFADVVLATSFGVNKKHRLQLNSSYSASIKKLESAHTLLRAVAAASILGLIGYTGYNFIAMEGLSGDNENLLVQKKTQEQSFAALKQASKQLPADVDEVVDLMFFYEILSEKKYTLLDFVKDISGMVDEQSLVSGLTWNANNLINASRNPKNGQKVQISFDVEMVYHEDSWELFQAKFDTYIKNIQELFPDYEITHSSLPGTFNTSDNLRVNFEDLASQRAGPPPGQVFNITVGITGPIEKPQNKKTSDAAPPLPLSPIKLAMGGR